MNAKWTQIVTIWALVAIFAVTLIAVYPADGQQVEAAFGAILAGSIALVSLLQLFKDNAVGFVRKLIYVGGGSYLILAIATAYLFLKG